MIHPSLRTIPLVPEALRLTADPGRRMPDMQSSKRQKPAERLKRWRAINVLA